MSFFLDMVVENNPGLAHPTLKNRAPWTRDGSGGSTAPAKKFLEQ